MTVHGFNVLHPLLDYPTIPTRTMRLWDCGVTWAQINPQRDVWDWARFDALVAFAELKSTGLLYVLGHTPQWAARSMSNPHAATWIGPSSNSLPASVADWETYVWTVATRYKGKITHYQVWNEPQLRQFLFPYDQINHLAYLTRRAKTIINQVDPAAKIVSAPVLPRESSGGMDRASKYLKALADQGWPVDVHAAHIYPESPSGPLRWLEMVQDWKVCLRDLEAPRMPLWVTETNYNLMGGPLPAKTMVKRYVDQTEKFANQSGVKRVYWYAWGVHSDPDLLGIRFTPDSAGTQAVSAYL